MFIRHFSAVIAGMAVLLSAIPAQAQSYSYPAPTPSPLAESNNPPERLAADDIAIVYGSWDFNYTTTPDNNIFVTRILVNDFAPHMSSTIVQIDCGRAMFRHIVSPLFIENGEGSGTPLDGISVNQWLILDQRNAFGQAMMRTCESAAYEEGIDWVWF